MDRKIAWEGKTDWLIQFFFSSETEDEDNIALQFKQSGQEAK